MSDDEGLREVCEWICGEFIANEIGYEGPMPSALRPFAIEWCLGEGGWPDRASAEAWLDETWSWA